MKRRAEGKYFLLFFFDGCEMCLVKIYDKLYGV